jgi:hypothetical protein
MPNETVQSSPGRRNGRVDKSKRVGSIGKPKRKARFVIGPHSRVEFVPFTSRPISMFGTNGI